MKYWKGKEIHKYENMVSSYLFSKSKIHRKLFKNEKVVYVNLSTDSKNWYWKIRTDNCFSANLYLLIV